LNLELPESGPLPLWRIIAGIAVFASFAIILAFLAPVYVDNFRLREYVRDLTAQSEAAAESDDQLRAEVLDRAHRLDLPVQGADIHIIHNGTRPHVEMRYKVRMDLALYQVDLHMAAASK
jgi:hypothetical protein